MFKTVRTFAQKGPKYPSNTYPKPQTADPTEPEPCPERFPLTALKGQVVTGVWGLGVVQNGGYSGHGKKYFGIVGGFSVDGFPLTLQAPLPDNKYPHNEKVFSICGVGKK